MGLSINRKRETENYDSIHVIIVVLGVFSMVSSVSQAHHCRCNH
jgi:hypothetical protein